jgi:hypothetical protein
MDNYTEETLLEEVTELTFEALADNKRWFSTWPPVGATIELNQQNMTLLPRAIKVTLSREGLDDFTQLVEFPR